MISVSMLPVAIAMTISVLSGCYGDRVSDEIDCETVNKTKLVCLRGSNSSTVVSVNCPSSYQVLFLSAAVYRNTDAGGTACPSTHDPSNTLCVEFTKDYSCSNNQCLLTVPNPSPVDLCDQGQEITSDPRDRYAVVVYRCQPQFSQYANASASAIAIDDPSIVSNPLIAINSNVLALTGVYITQTSSFCSAIIPRHTEAVVRAFFFHVKTTDGRSDTRKQQCVNVAVKDGLETDCIVMSSLCSVTDAPLALGCWPTERFLEIRYSNTNPNASIVFVIHLQVSYTRKITIQCGSPTFPLVVGPMSSSPVDPLPMRSSSLDPLDASTAAADDQLAGISVTKLIVALSCGLGGLILILIAIIITAMVCRHSRKRPVQHQPLSETPSINSISGDKIYLGDQNSISGEQVYVEDRQNEIPFKV